MPNGNKVVAGIDGCRAGWLCVTKDFSTGDIVARILRRIDDVLHLNQKPAVVAVDIPIGLTDAGPRCCDLEARAKLGRPRASSVFPAPIRPMLNATTYQQACQIGLCASGKKLSMQTWTILPKIREVDIFMRSNTAFQTRVYEVHPEVCFWAWNNRCAMQNKKKTSAGRAERENLVKPCYGQAYQAAQNSLPRGQYANDDLLDAFAALWSAERILTNQNIVLPANPPTDSCGLRMEMVA